jgi:hypothetical protein
LPPISPSGKGVGGKSLAVSSTFDGLLDDLLEPLRPAKLAVGSARANANKPESTTLIVLVLTILSSFNCNVSGSLDAIREPVFVAVIREKTLVIGCKALNLIARRCTKTAAQRLLYTRRGRGVRKGITAFVLT